MNVTEFDLIKARHLNKPMTFFGDNAQIISETAQQSVVIVDTVGDVVHILSPNTATRRGEEKVIIKSLPLDFIQYLTSSITLKELDQVLAGLKTAGVIDAAKETAIKALYEKE